MKELFQKKFWQDVKKTFEEAQEEVPAKGPEAQLPPVPEAAPQECAIPLDASPDSDAKP